MDHLRAFDALVRAETRLWNGLDRALQAAGHPSLARTHVLRVVAATPGCRVQDVARTIDITHGGASKLLDRLVEAGLLVRGQDPADGRASVLRLTADGVAAVAGAEQVASAWLATHLAGTDADQPLDTHLTRVVDHLQENP